jgi:hypothetical protein
MKLDGNQIWMWRDTFKQRSNRSLIFSPLGSSKPAEKRGFTQCKADKSHKQADDDNGVSPFVVCIGFHCLASLEFID